MIHPSTVLSHWRPRLVKYVLNTLLILQKLLAQFLEARQQSLPRNTPKVPFGSIFSPATHSKGVEALSALLWRFLRFAFQKHHASTLPTKGFAGIECDFVLGRSSLLSEVFAHEGHILLLETGGSIGNIGGD